MNAIRSPLTHPAPNLTTPDATPGERDPSSIKPRFLPALFRDYLLIAFAALVFAFPMAIHGPMLHGYDTREHLSYSRHFSEQFWAGEWYPRWLIGIHHGLGSPSLFVYPPLPTYVEALLEPLARLLHWSSFRVGEYLALFLSGICAYLWLSTMAVKRVALVGCVLYMLMPYHLALDYYRKTALAECWALAWMPLVLYFGAKIITQRKRADLAGLAVAYSFLILSHLVSVLIFSCIPLAIGLALSPKGEKLRSTFCIGLGMALGTGLSCFYFLSALANAKYFPVYRLPLWHLWDRYLLSLTVLRDSNYDSFTRATYFSVLDLIALCAVCGGIVLSRRDFQLNPERRKTIFFWLAVCALPTFLMLSISSVVWAKFPLLLTTVQFPFRFSIVLCIATAAILTSFLSELSHLSRRVKVVSLILLSLGLIPFLISYAGVWRSYARETEPPRRVVNEGDGWFYSWTPPGMDEFRALAASAGPKVRFLSGSGTADLSIWQPRHLEFETDSPTGGWVMVNQFYYPAWRAVTTSSNTPLEARAALPEGLLEVQVPPGRQQIRVEIPVGRAERVGLWISVICGVFCLLLIWEPTYLFRGN
jgi:hypothetical protein